MTLSYELQKSLDIYYQTHLRRPDYFRGNSLVGYISEIKDLIDHSNIKTCIDYGCGQANAWSFHNLQQLFGLEKIILFDPGVQQYSTQPTEQADLVLSIDVLEHVPEKFVDEVLTDICSFAKKAVFLNISTRPASKKLVDGTNAHATVKPKQWWQDKINSMDKLIIARYTS
jgi:hypothetical protein